MIFQFSISVSVDAFSGTQVKLYFIVFLGYGRGFRTC